MAERSHARGLLPCWLVVLLSCGGAASSVASASAPPSSAPNSAPPSSAPSASVARALRPPPLTTEAIAKRTPKRWQRDAVDDVDKLFPGAELKRWQRYHQHRRQLALLALGLDLLCYALLLGALGRALYALAQRGSERLGDRLSGRLLGLRALAARILGASWGAALLFAALYFALGVLLDLPFALYREHLAREVGLSTISTALWWRHTAIGLSLGALAFAALVVGLFGLVRRFPRSWWAILALPVALALFASALLAPYGTRIYQRLVPLAQSRFAGRTALEPRLRALAKASKITISRVLVIDGSRRSRALNAYVSGVGPTRELVLYDTLLDVATDREVAVVLAHELAHLDEPLGPHARTALAALALALFLALIALLLRWGARRNGFESPGDVRLLPLIGLASILLFNLALPARNALSRQREEAADQRALVMTADPAAFISLQQKLVRRNRSDPRPSAWVRFWLASHPSATERIGLARWYQRWLRAPR